ncbi:MAG: hypothetical protein WA705_13310 [Candidatus Ozemobacteraceae bacterium]
MAEMNLITCRVCGTVMVKLSRDVCNKCFQLEEELFKKVKDFLRANPGASVYEVAIALDAPSKQVEAFVNSGRLERVGVHVMHQCRTCSRIIPTGIICSDCASGIKSQVNSLKRTISDDHPKGSEPVKPDSDSDDYKGFRLRKDKNKKDI